MIKTVLKAIICFALVVLAVFWTNKPTTDISTQSVKTEQMATSTNEWAVANSIPDLVFLRDKEGMITASTIAFDYPGVRLVNPPYNKNLCEAKDWKLIPTDTVWILFTNHIFYQPTKALNLYEVASFKIIGTDATINIIKCDEGDFRLGILQS